MRSFLMSRAGGATFAAAGLGAALAFAASFPAVEGLGTKVRLPVFHGALTWVNLMGFLVLALCAVVYAIRGDERVYSWQEAVRWTVIPEWLIGSALGFVAAMNTWDFTGSKSSPLAVAAADPRLSAQFWIMILAAGVLVSGLLVDDRKLLAAIDAGFVLVAGFILGRAVLGPGRALHPDSPVLNSEELGIKLMFLGIVVGLAVFTWGVALAVKAWRSGEASAAAGE